MPGQQHLKGQALLHRDFAYRPSILRLADNLENVRLLRHRTVPGRTLSTENFRGGKTACYVFPILWQLNNTACYSDLPPKCGSPIVIVVCPSSKHVMKVHSQVASLLTHQDDLPNKGVDLAVAYLFGRCEQAKQEASAKSGSHILVCTPNCLLRMFDRSATSFERLCHLVFEEADILLDVFKPQVERIMDGLRLESMNRKSEASPRQVLVFSQYWTPELDSFVAGNLVDPTVAIATAIEVFYSAGVDISQEGNLGQARKGNGPPDFRPYPKKVISRFARVCPPP